MDSVYCVALFVQMKILQKGKTRKYSELLLLF